MKTPKLVDCSELIKATVEAAWSKHPLNIKLYPADTFLIYQDRQNGLEFIDGGFKTSVEASHKAMKFAKASPGNRFVVLNPKGLEIASFQSENP